MKPEFADVDRSDQGKASVGPQEQETTEEEGDLARMDSKAEPVDSLTASSAGGVVNSGLHSPIPWRRDRLAQYVWADDARGEMMVAQIRGWGHLTGVGGWRLPEEAAIAVQQANADFIVTACNAHDALVSQREELVKVLKQVIDTSPQWVSRAELDVLHRIHAVLAKAGA